MRTSTTASFSLSRPEEAPLSLYDAGGRRLGTLLDGRLAEGAHAVRWDARSVPSGVYYYRLAVGSEVESDRLVVAK